jgi:hypothetical protein
MKLLACVHKPLPQICGIPVRRNRDLSRFVLINKIRMADRARN